MIQPRGGIRASEPAFVVLTVAAGALAGLAPGLLPLTTSLILCAAGLLLLLIATIRWLVPTEVARRPEASPAESGPVGEPLDASDDVVAEEPTTLRLARALFYIGAATVAQASWRPGLGLTVSEIVFLAAFACCCLAVLRGHPIARVPSSLAAGVLVFATGGAISSLNAASVAESGVEVLQAIYVMLLWVGTATMVLRTRRHVIVAITLWGLSAAVNGVGAISQVAGIGDLAGPLEGSRATGFTDHPNDLGAAAAVALVPCLLLATSGWDRSPGVRSLRWVITVLVTLGLVFSASVAAMAAALIALIMWFSLPSARGGRVAVVLAIAAALMSSFAWGGEVTSPVERLEQVTSPIGTSPAAGSGSERLEIVESVWPRIVEDPFVGSGLGREDLSLKILSGGVTREQQVHGAPLAAWYEAGILGFLGMLLVLVALAVTGWRASSGAHGASERRIGWGLIAAFSGFVVYALSAPMYFQQYGWLAAVMLVAWWSQVDVPVTQRAAATTLPADGSRLRWG
jgi:hypothetical protein